MARLELVLYHDQDATGLVQWSTAAPTGPWTDSRLASPTPLRAALDAWATAIGTAASRTVTFTWSGGVISLTVSGGSLWLKLTPALQELLGFASNVITNGDASGTPTGIADLPIGRTEPQHVEDVDIRQYRGARVTAYHWGRALQTTLDLFISPDLWDDLEGSQIVSGYGAIKVTWDNTDDYDEDDLDGAMLVFPTDSEVEPRLYTDDTTVVHVTGTLLDPGVSASTVQDTAWARFWRAIPYGYSAHYFARVEGIPYLLCEFVGDAIAPTNYTLDASLVVDDLSPLGSIVSPSTGFPAAYDLELRLLDTTAVRSLVATPTLVTQLRVEAQHDDTTIAVETVDGWSGVSPIYVGPSAEVVTGIAAVRRFVVPTRGVYGRARTFPRGTLVTDTPTVWDGRRVEVFAVLRDPTGRYVQGSDLLSDAVIVATGSVRQRPYRSGTDWILPCRDESRRLTHPLGVAASGKAVWEVDDDGLVAVDPLCTFAIEIAVDGSTIETHVVRPFEGLTGQKRRSELRALVAAAFEAACVTSGDVSGFHWRAGVDMPVAPVIAGVTNPFDAYGLFFVYAADGSTTNIMSSVDRASFAVDSFRLFFGGVDRSGLPSSAADVEVYTGLRCISTVAGVALSVIMDDRAPDLLPTTGWVQLEASGRTSYLRYTDADVDATDPARINLTIDGSTPFSPDEVLSIAYGTIGDVSVKFFWRDSGRLYDIARRAIVSTGDGVNGAFDTLPRGQGLGLPDIDSDSFVSVFDTFFRDLDFALGSNAGVSLETLLSGLLRLSSRALVARRNAAATALEIAAVRVGSVDGLPVATIDDAALIGDGARPVRVLEVFTAPRAIEVKCRTLPVGDTAAADATIGLVGKWHGDAIGDAWQLDVYGVSRAAILPAAKAWATGIFRTAQTSQLIELTLPPWYDLQAGDIVELDLVDPNLWDYADGVTGSPGYQGLVRVLGAQLSLATGVQKVRVAADGILAAGPMAPSLPIVAVNGGATTPTSIDVDDEFFDLLTAAKDGETSWKVLAYLPGQDSGRAEYTISTVTAPGGGVTRLTVTAYPSAPSVTLTTSYRLTWPVADECTDDQDRYLHNTDRAQWS